MRPSSPLQRLPDFLILGGQKCGTTWLTVALARQPAVFIPRRKELHYFTREFRRGHGWYAAQFAGARDACCIGESTPNYLAANFPEYLDVPERIHSILPHARFIVILRDPVDRALSAYMHHVMRGRFRPASGVASHFELLLSGDVSTAGIVEFGLYGAQLERYFEIFDRKQFLILSYEDDLCCDPRTTVERVLWFIEAPHGRVDSLPRPRNVGARSQVAARIGAWLSMPMKDEYLRMRLGSVVQQGCRFVEGLVHASPFTLDTDLLRRLRAVYQADGDRLRSLLGKEAPRWARLPAR